MRVNLQNLIDNVTVETWVMTVHILHVHKNMCTCLLIQLESCHEMAVSYIHVRQGGRNIYSFVCEAGKSISVRIKLQGAVEIIMLHTSVYELQSNNILL